MPDQTCDNLRSMSAFGQLRTIVDFGPAVGPLMTQSGQWRLQFILPDLDGGCHKARPNGVLYIRYIRSWFSHTFMVSYSSSASRSLSRQSLGICAATRGHHRQGWRTFLSNHADGIAAVDLFVLPTIAFRILYCLVIIRHGRRIWVSFGVTANPTAEWISRQITEAFPWDHAPRYLIRDRDTSYGPVFVQRLRAMGIRDRPIAFRSPWQNAYVERLIGSIRRECLDHMIVFGEAHLRRILGAYAAYYNESRTHRSLNKDAPFHRAIERLGAITSHPILGGLHHQYCRI